MNIDYEKQATDFLRSCGVSGVQMFAEKAVPQVAPRWAKDGKHGVQWSITLARMRGKMRSDQFIAGLKEMHYFIDKSVQFFFWDSVANKERDEKRGHTISYKKPTAYSVLSGLYNPCDSFEDFCANYGYSEDSREAEKTYNEVLELNRKLESLFLPEELSRLQEIQ